MKKYNRGEVYEQWEYLSNNVGSSTELLLAQIGYSDYDIHTNSIIFQRFKIDSKSTFSSIHLEILIHDGGERVQTSSS